MGMGFFCSHHPRSFLFSSPTKFSVLITHEVFCSLIRPQTQNRGINFLYFYILILQSRFHGAQHFLLASLQSTCHIKQLCYSPNCIEARLPFCELYVSNMVELKSWHWQIKGF